MICKKCNNAISDDSDFCHFCGHPIETISGTSDGTNQIEDKASNTNDIDEKAHSEDTSQDRPSFSNNITSADSVEAVSSQKKRKRRGFIVAGSAVAVALIIGAIFWLSSGKIVAQDLSKIDGCPEFYNVKFGMNAEEASSLIKTGHKTITGYENSLGHQDSFIYTENGYGLYGLQASDVYCGFDVLKLDSVILLFPKEKVTLEQVVGLYTKIYGASADNRWIGPKTAIEIWDDELHDQGKKEIVVRYTIAKKDVYTMLSLDGTEIDPYGFTGKNLIFGKKATDFISGLTPDVDYTTNKNEYYTSYTLYPAFEYMRLPRGSSGIEVFVDSGESTISSVNYIFLLNNNEPEKLVSQIEYMNGKLSDEYGQSVSCTYASLVLDGSGQKNITFNEMKSMFKNSTQGMYHIQWKKNGSYITLGVTIDPRQKYIRGTVTFAD